MLIIIDKIISFLYTFLFFATPLFFLFNTSELFEFNKILLIYSLTVLVGFFWLLKMILTKRIIIKKTLLDIPIIVFLVSQIISTIFSIDRHTSFFGYYSRFNGGLLSIFCYVFLYYGFVSNKINPFLILKSSLISSFFVILYAIPGKLGRDITCFLASRGKIFDNSCWDNSILQFQPDVRAFSTLGQPNWFGAYLVVNFFIGLYYLLINLKIKNNQKIKNEDFFQKLWDLKNLFFIKIYLFLNISFILFTRSRSALLALFICIGLFLFYYVFFIRLKIKKLAVVIFILIFVTPFFLFKTGINKIDNFLDFSKFVFYKEKVSNDKLQPLIKKDNQSRINSQQSLNITDSADIRKIVWKGAVLLGLRYPLFGTGVETFAYSYNFTRPIEHNYTSEWDFIYNKAHNEFLNYFATTGFFGLISYLLMIAVFQFFVFYLILKIKKLNFEKSEIKKNQKINLSFYEIENIIILIICLNLSYISILITNFFGFSTTTINLYFYLIPGLIFILNDENLFQKNKKSNSDINIKNFSYYQLFFIFGIIFLSIYFLFYIYRYYKADVYYSLGSNYLKLKEPDYKAAVYYLQEALKIRSEHVYQDKLSFSFAYLSALLSLNKDENKNLINNLIDLSKYYNDKSLSVSSKNIFYLKTKAKNYYYYYLATNNKNYLFDAIRILDQSRFLAPTDPKIPYTIALFYKELEKIEKDRQKKDYFRNKIIEEVKKGLLLKRDYQEIKEILKLN